MPTKTSTYFVPNKNLNALPIGQVITEAPVLLVKITFFLIQHYTLTTHSYFMV